MSGWTHIQRTFEGQVALRNGEVTTRGVVTTCRDGLYVEAGDLRMFVHDADVYDVLNLDMHPDGILEEAS